MLPGKTEPVSMGTKISVQVCVCLFAEGSAAINHYRYNQWDVWECGHPTAYMSNISPTFALFKNMQDSTEGFIYLDIF